jgi:hypothetical protein
MRAKLSIFIAMLVFAFACSGLVSAAIPEGLVFLATFDDKSGDKVSDLSGFKNNGTVKGKVEWVAGKFGGGFRFDGATYITVTSAKPLSELTHPMSAGAWVSSEAFPANSNIVEMDGATGWKLGFTNANPQWTTYHVFDFNSTRVVKQGEWTHVAATWDGAQAIFYVNGQAEAPVAGGGVINVTGEPSLDIGYRRVGAASFYKGILDDVFVFKKVLKQDEIQNYMTKGFAGIMAVEPWMKIAATWGAIKR